MKTKITVVLAVSILLAAFVTVASAQQAPDRTVLPVQEPKPPLYKELDVRNAKMPPHFEVKAPVGAPNVVLILIDDLGFGATQPFGGPIPTPTLERLAQEGLRYNNFHTTALCSPTRAALKSGRNHHTVNMAFITEMATGFPGATGQIPNATAPERVQDHSSHLGPKSPQKRANRYWLCRRAFFLHCGISREDHQRLPGQRPS